ncbi:hypothetical protein P3S68_023283 [Capsicum galapagoense]
MRMCWFITTLIIVAFFLYPAYAYDLNTLQDICVAVDDSKASVLVNGKICKDPKLVKADDFFASGLNVSGSAMSQFGISVNIVDVNVMPGLNTLGISIVRVDLEPQGLVLHHTHPRATELTTVIEGTVYAGFLAPDPANIFKSRLFSKILNPGDVQNPGFVLIPSSIFASDPPILDDVLAKGFQLDKKVIEELRKKLS